MDIKHKKPGRLMKRPITSQKGTTVVEFAIILPLLVLLVFAMIEFGLYLFNRQVITNACREGARAGVVVRPVRMSNEEIENVVRDYSERHLVTFGTDKTIDVHLKAIDNDMDDGFDPDTSRCTDFGCDLEVEIDYPYEFLFLTTIGISTQNIQGISRMKME